MKSGEVQKDECRPHFSDRSHRDPGVCAQSGAHTLRADEQATMTTLAGLVVVLMMVVQEISDLFDLVQTLFGL